MPRVQSRSIVGGQREETHADIRSETTIANVVVAGITARDEAAIRHHLDEMKDLGVKPESFPFFFRVSAGFLTQAEHIQVLGTDSSGEVERVIVALDAGSGSPWARTIPIARSKRIPSTFRSRCPHPIGRHLWPIAEVSAHWDRLIARSCARRQARTLSGGTARDAAPRRFGPQRYAVEGGRIGPGTILFCGTIGAKGPLAYADLFEMELEDLRWNVASVITTRSRHCRSSHKSGVVRPLRTGTHPRRHARFPPGWVARYRIVPGF